MWEVRTQFSRASAEGNSTELEWSAILADTEVEAQGWWQCRTQGQASVRCVHTLIDPEGMVVRVQFK